MRVAAAVLLVGAHVAVAQKPAVAGVTDVAAGASRDAAIATWRDGLEISVNGAAWERTLTVGLSKAQCPPSTSSPCAAGSAVAVDVRFPPIAQAIDLSKARAQLGEAPSQSGDRYEVRLVREQSSALCAPGFSTSSAYANPRMAVNVGGQGPPLPLTCRWTAIVGIPDATGSHVAVVWSDTVVLQLTSKP